MLVYDCCDRSTFNSVENWLKQISLHAPAKSEVVLVANKIDMDNREVTTEEGKEIAEVHGIKYFETSAKTAKNVDEVFNYCAERIMNTKGPSPRPNPYPDSFSISNESVHKK